jgi:outer membrane protein assembly factor BamB
MFQHDPQHTGFSSSPMPTHFKEAWRYKEYDKHGARLIIAEKKVLVAQRDSFSLLDADDGILVMDKSHAVSYGLPMVIRKRVLMSAYNGLYSFDSETGERIWGYGIKFVTVYSSPIFVGDRVFVGSGLAADWTPPEYGEEAYENTKRVACLDLETGEVIWEFAARKSTEFSPAFYNGRVYVNDSSDVYCLDAETGSLIWQTDLEKTNFSAVSLDGERIFVGISDGVTCLDMETGRILWHFDCGERAYTTPAVAYRKIYFGTPTGIFYCLDAESGNQVWKIDTKEASPQSEADISSEIIAADNKVAFGTGNGVLYIADAESGAICESVDLGDMSIISMALAEGRLVVGLWDGTVICFEESSFWKTVPLVIVSAVIVSFLVFFRYYRRVSLRSSQ